MSLNQVIQLAMSISIAMSVYLYVWDLTNRREKDKRHHDLIAALREAPT
jgi:uncharacterized membrane protein YccC